MTTHITYLKGTFIFVKKYCNIKYGIVFIKWESGCITHVNLPTPISVIFLFPLYISTARIKSKKSSQKVYHHHQAAALALTIAHPSNPHHFEFPNTNGPTSTSAYYPICSNQSSRKSTPGSHSTVKSRPSSNVLTVPIMLYSA